MPARAKIPVEARPSPALPAALQLPPAPHLSPPSVPPVSALPVRPAQQITDLRETYAALLWRSIAAARPNGIHIPGTARIAFRLDANGRLLDLSLAQSSGSALLDRLALRTVRTASPFPPPPAGLGPDQLAFVIAFRFDDVPVGEAEPDLPIPIRNRASLPDRFPMPGSQFAFTDSRRRMPCV